MAFREPDEGVRPKFAPPRRARHPALRRVRRRAHRRAESEQYRFLVVEHSMEIYVALVAALFAGLGIWLGLTLTRKKQTVIIKEVPVTADGPIRRRRNACKPVRHHRTRAGDSRAHRQRVE